MKGITVQITIIQSEIEQAIRDYVGRQMKVHDGMELLIDISATRGSEGFKATIDIRPINSIKPEHKAPFLGSEVKVEEAPIRQQPFVVARTTAPVVEQPEPEEKAPFEETASVETVVAAEATQGDGVAQPAEAAASQGRSLFKGLGKPKNN